MAELLNLKKGELLNLKKDSFKLGVMVNEG